MGPDPPPAFERVVRWAFVDLAPRHRQPPWALVAVATVVALAGSLVADALAVHVATRVAPSIAHFSHFRVADYASLTVVGVLAACGGWPAVTRISSEPRRLFLRVAVAATIVLWVPDAWLLAEGARAAGVATLAVMHLLVAVVTYNSLVHLAPVHRTPQGADAGTPATFVLSEDVARRLWNAMAAVVVLSVVLGVATIVSVPFRRPDALFPSRSTWLYVAHAAVGIVLGLGAAVVLALSPLAGRMARIGAVLGAAGVAVGLAGGVLATFQVTRLVGMGVMLLGAVVAAVGYLVPALERMGRAEVAKARAARDAMHRAAERVDVDGDASLHG